MAEIDRDLCRKAAAECIELARTTTDLAVKQSLLTRAQEWLKLAYSHDAELEHHLDQFNRGQLGPGGSPTVKPQLMQQQQKKSTEDEK